MANNSSDYSKLYSFLLASAKDKKNVSIFCHNSPDPDAMASALAVQVIAVRAKMKANIYYDGEINHSQNRAMINVLDINMTKISDLANGSFEDHLSYKCEEKLVPEWWGKSKRKAIKKRIVFIQNRIKEVKLTGNKEVSKYDLSMRWQK